MTPARPEPQGPPAAPGGALPPGDVSDPGYWQALYERGADRWELAGPAPPLAAHLNAVPPPPGRVAVPGCGRGHDCRLLARAGYQVWGFDFAPAALEAARGLAAREGVAVTFEAEDVFGLGGRYAGFFDGVWEYTCFPALDPRRRAAYVTVLATILRPGGWLLACFFPVRPEVPPRPPGPPFPVTRAEIGCLLAPHFAPVQAREPEASAPGRQGLEWLVVARRRDVRAP